MRPEQDDASAASDEQCVFVRVCVCERERGRKRERGVEGL